MKNKERGYSYRVTLKDIYKYQKVSIEKRLIWLYQGNLLRMSYPEHVIKIQEKFRTGKI